MSKDLREAGVYSIGDGGPRIAPNAGALIRHYLGSKNPPTNLPIPVWPLAIWRFRGVQIESIESAVGEFTAEFGLDQFEGVFDFSPPPAAVVGIPLGPAAVTEEELLGLLEPRTETPGGEPANQRPDEPQEPQGVGDIIGVALNPDGDVTLGGKPVQLLLHGCPGSGKSFKLASYSREAHYVFRTVMHPEARYADLVGGLRPRTGWRLEDPPPTFVGFGATVPGEPRVIYEFVPGPLLQAYYLACFEPLRSVVLIIEELSRGNAAQCFGDFLQLLDRLDEEEGGVPAGSSCYAIDPRPEVRSWILNNDIDPPHAPRGQVRLPANLFIWATMNRADQNARQLDSAFLRRWAREHCSWKTEGDAWEAEMVTYGGGTIPWGSLRKAINDKLARLPGVPEDKFVGPYFIPKRRLRQPNYLLEDLWGYLWHEVLKTRAADFFGVPTFAELAENWAEGNGSPIGEVATE
jgi:hypothetical protein